MNIIDVPQQSEEWKRVRFGLATASCFDAVLAKGKGSAKSLTRADLRLRLALERINDAPLAGFEGNGWTNQGNEREPLARIAYEIHTGRLVDQVGFCRHETLEAGCSPDGLIGEDGLYESKCPKPRVHHATIQKPRVPLEYVPQVQGSLWVTGRKWADFVSFNPNFPKPLDLIIVRSERDEDYITALELAVTLFLDEVRAEEAAIRARLG